MPSRLDAVLTVGDDRYLLFQGSQAARLSTQTAKRSDAASVPLAKLFGGLPKSFQSGIDAALPWPLGRGLSKLHLFKGDQVVTYPFGVASNGLTGGTRQAAVPIAKVFDGLPPAFLKRGLDAAVYIPDTAEAVFFSGPEIQRWNTRSNTPSGQPQTLAGLVKDLPPFFADGVDSAFALPTKSVVLVKGEYAVRIDPYGGKLLGEPDSLAGVFAGWPDPFGPADPAPAPDAEEMRKLYAFVTNVERLEGHGDPSTWTWLVDLEGLQRGWFQQAWWLIGAQAEAAQALELIGQQRIEELYPKLTDPQKALLYRVHIFYQLTTVAAGSEAPVSTLQILVPPDSPLRNAVQTGSWFELDLGAGTPMQTPDQPPDGTTAVQALLGPTPAADGPVVAQPIERFEAPDPRLQALLLFLHFPQANRDTKGAFSLPITAMNGSSDMDIDEGARLLLGLKRGFFPVFGGDRRRKRPREDDGGPPPPPPAP